MRRGYLMSICRRMPITRQPYFLPTQITGCSLWLDAADSSTVILSGVNVTQWNDKSGNAANATASGNGLIYTQSAINSKPAILLPGNTTYTFFTGTSISGTLNQAIFIVITTISGITQYSRLFSFGGAGDYNSLGNMVVGWNSPGGVLIERNGIFLPSTNALVYSTPFITSSVISGTSVLGYINGTNTLTGTTTSTNFTHSQYEIGSYTGSGGYTWYGYVGEVIIYNSSISDTQRQQIEGYLAQKWGLTASLISGHPGLDKIIHRNLQTTFTKKQYFTAFSPRQIGGCALWFDATDSSTITLSSGSLTQWNDKSGNGRNLTAVFANATVSSAYQNGLNVFNFSGNALYRTAADTAVYPQDVYIIIALKSTTAHVDVLGVGATNTGNFNSLTFGEYTASRWHNGSDYYNRTPNCISPTNETSTSFLLIQWSIANGNYLIRRNGTQLVQTATYSWTLPSGSIFQIGYRHPDNNGVNFSGYIGEIIVFNNQIGTTDRQNVESYLTQKWGLVSSLPAGHLNATFPAGSPTAIQPYVTSIRTALIFQGRPPSAVGAVSIASLTTIPASFTWSSGTLATSYNFYIITPSGTSTLVASNIAYSAGATTITFSSTLTYASGNWRGGVQSVNQYGSSTTVLSGTTTMATPFPYSLNPITTASRTNFIFRDTRRQNQLTPYYWTYCIKLNDDSWAELRTNYSDANSFVSVNSSSGDVYSSGETDPYGNSLFFYYDSGFGFNNSYKHYVRTLSGNSTAAFIAGTKTANPSVSIQLGNGTYLINDKTTALYTDNGYLL